ncbi:MAG: hypothetical protein PHS49_02980 [Candidatus Gracilibacteria bacterium]|nr:hypothetical protein [Candidatus Gracilibacteria bacterium]
MYKILIVGALSQELNVVKEHVKNLAIRNVKTSYLSTGVGNYNMILNLTRFLEQNSDFDFVVNVGVCGYVKLTQIKTPLNSPLPAKDWTRVRGDEDQLFNRGNLVIQIARILNLSNNKELIIPKLFDFGELSSIASSEVVVYDENDLNGESYVDMESYGFEKVCDSFSLPRIILKVPVDKVGDETRNFDFQKAKTMLESIDYKIFFEKIFNYLENTFSSHRNINEKEVFEKYKDYFGFTFSETEIFKRFYYRYLALVNDDFDRYFDENKELTKKVFLKNLETYLEGFLIK